MAQQTINLGTVDNDNTGDTAKAGGAKINANFTELYTANMITPQMYGVVEGAGVSGAQRLSNGTNFQAAINAAVANTGGERKIFYVPRGIYEIDLPGGLEFASYGGRWIGHKHSHIVQFATNTPVITFGQKNTSSTSETAAQVVDGVSVRYGNVVAGTDTLSNAVVFSRVWAGDYRNFDIGDVNEQYPNAKYMYRGIWITNNFFFSNNLTNFRVKHFLFTGLHFAVQGTGNVFTNMYFSNGNLSQTIGTVSSCVSLNASGSVIQENVWNQLNCEWSNAFHALDLVNARNQVFNSVHVEGVHLRSNNAYFKLNSAASVIMNGVTMLDCQPTTNGGMVFGMGWDSTAIVSMIGFEKFNQTAPKTIALVSHETGGEVRRSLIKIAGFRINTNVVLNSADTSNQTGTNDTGKPLKELGGVLPTPEGLSTIGDTDLVVSGQSHPNKIRYNTPLTADRSVTLTNKYDFGTTNGALLTIPDGAARRIIRTSAATGAFTLTVNHSAIAAGTSPTALGTLAVNEYMDVVLSGGTWVVIGRGTAV